MSQLIDRRGFMHVCATATAAAGGMWKLASSASAIEPIVRNGTPKFKFSLAAYSYRDLLTGSPSQLTLVDFINDCASRGVASSSESNDSPSTGASFAPLRSRSMPPRFQAMAFHPAEDPRSRPAHDHRTTRASTRGPSGVELRHPGGSPAPPPQGHGGRQGRTTGPT